MKRLKLVTLIVGCGVLGLLTAGCDNGFQTSNPLGGASDDASYLSSLDNYALNGPTEAQTEADDQANDPFGNVGIDTSLDDGDSAFDSLADDDPALDVPPPAGGYGGYYSGLGYGSEYGALGLGTGIVGDGGVYGGDALAQEITATDNTPGTTVGSDPLLTAMGVPQTETLDDPNLDSTLADGGITSPTLASDSTPDVSALTAGIGGVDPTMDTTGIAPVDTTPVDTAPIDTTPDVSSIGLGGGGASAPAVSAGPTVTTLADPALTATG